MRSVESWRSACGQSDSAQRPDEALDVRISALFHEGEGDSLLTRSESAFATRLDRA